MWVFLAILSAIGLGFYDICKKRALTYFRVIPVLTGSVVVSSLLLLPMYILSRVGALETSSLLYVPHVCWHDELLIILKALIVLSSWVCAYYSLRRLPITVVTPMNATRPMWTLLGAVLIFGETLNAYQWSGVAVALISFTAFAYVSMPHHRTQASASTASSAKSGVQESEFFPYLMLLLAVLLGAASGLYDKHLMRHIDHNAVLVYYTWYQAIFMSIAYLWDQRKNLPSTLRSFLHQPSTINPKSLTINHQPLTKNGGLWILGISVFLSLADFVYLLALSDPDSLIAVVSLLRRSSVLITFAYGALILHESNLRRKAICLSGILTAMVLLLLGSL